MMNDTPSVALISKMISSHSDRTRAVKNKKYLKSSLKHKGLTVPQLRAIAKTWLQENINLPIGKVVQVTSDLWTSDIHEYRSVALYILEYRSKDLGYSDLEFLEELASEVTDWSHLDQIGVSIVGSILEKDTTGLLFLPIWGNSTNVWVRRLAIISQIRLFRNGDGNMSIYKDVVKAQLNESDDWSKEEKFFIRKAIGWSLRERSKADPESVVAFVNLLGHKMHSLSVREATKNLKSGYRKMILGDRSSK